MHLFTATNVRVYDLQQVINVCEDGVCLKGGLPPCLFSEIPCERTIRTQVSNKRMEGAPTKDSPHVFKLIVRSSHEVISQCPAVVFGELCEAYDSPNDLPLRF